MLKFFVVSVYIMIAASGAIVEKPGETLEAKQSLNETVTKISEGKPVKRGQVIDYAFLTVAFINQVQVCGGVLITDEWVLTSATCLYEYWKISEFFYFYLNAILSFVVPLKA